MTAATSRAASVVRYRERRGLTIGVGIGMLALAAAAAFFPAPTALAMGAASGWLLWMAGGLMLGFALVTLTGRLRLLGAAAALAAVGMGAFLTFNPTVGAVAVGLAAAAAFVVDGSFQIAVAMKLRPLKVWRWMLASALASLIAAGLLVENSGRGAPETVAIMLCAGFLSTGAALVALGVSRA